MLRPRHAGSFQGSSQCGPHDAMSIFIRERGGIALAGLERVPSVTTGRWSVTKQVGVQSVQEAYTEPGGFMASKKGSSKRELIDTGTDKRYVRRDDKGRFNESDDQGRSLSQDVKRRAKTVAKPGQGDKGDRKRS